MKFSLANVATAAVLLTKVGSAFVLPEFFQEAFVPIRGDEQAFWEFLWGEDELEDLDPELIEPEGFPKPHIPYFLKPMVESEKLQEKITVEDLNATALDILKIANASTKHYGHPTRVIGSPGHWKTIRYILKQFDDMKDYYEVSVQAFHALAGKIESFNLSDAKTGETFPNTTAFSLSPPAEPFVGELVQIPNLGCDASDFESVTPEPPFEKQKKKIALIERGLCPFGNKSELAGQFGYSAVVIFDNDPKAEGGLHGTLNSISKHSVSTIGVTHETGKKLIERILLNKHYFLEFAMDSYVKKIKTKNIIADTKHGDEDNIVALGAHSDSVEEGPGLNDDGSGTISLLNVAKQLTHFKINNKVRFAWWSAEEEGLLGSTYYANNLTKEENLKIRVFMDYDMMASPNYEYEVYDANNKDDPKGSEELKNLYIDYYKSKNLTYTLVPFDGRSDYVGFIENGIPAGGIATGAEKKNVNNGKVLDKCYHSLCDDISNLAWDAFLVNTQLIAHSVATYANSFEGFPERDNATVKTEVVGGEPRFKYRADYLIV
ncbi:hypothetical protein HG536_0F01790 [Torulaspora globosa]|uniref:Peptide hydrolase n=1 Tax=Torulaspora globosa TaxID=48254 RepID=A0A7G3ZK18_9SACH|nr:uncharacterized protein HG536_0F01790 [Torulaspora globosa]QLL33854.1 hypothetical protein HG536_0F01790 [Torulaspora globosa]